MTSPARFAGLGQRILTALVLLPLVIGAIYAGGGYFLSLLILISIPMAWEWVHLLQSADARADRIRLSGAAVLILASGFFTPPQNMLALLFILGLFFSFLALLRKRRGTVVGGGIFYCVLPLLGAYWLRLQEDGLWLVLFMFLSVCAVDIFAMFFGKLIGGAKLAPRLSPNKTWAGLGGAIIGSLSIAFAFSVYFERAFAAPIIIFAILLAVIAQMADLFESMLKRKYNLKDSGALLPGHGGILDRVDGLIGALILTSLFALWGAFMGTVSSPLIFLWGWI